MSIHSPTPTIGFPFVGDTSGGSHLSALLLMQELPNFGFRAVALVHRNGPLTDYLDSKGTNFFQTSLPYFDTSRSGIAALARSLSVAPRIASFLRRSNISLVHVNDGRMIASWTLAARLTSCPVVIHARHRWSQSRLAYMCFRLARTRVAISSYVRDSMPTKLAESTMIISTPFEAPVRDYTSARKSMFALIGRERHPLVAFAGTLVEQKRPSVFLNTAAYLSRKTDAHFVLFGRNGDYLDDLKQQTTQLGIIDRVTFAGFRPDFGNLLTGCDLLIAPAVNEGHGRVLVEAMLARVPIIAADSGGHREIIQDQKTGLLVTPDNPGAFSEAAMLFLNESDFREKIIETAWSWASSTFSPRQHAQQIASVYRSLMKTL